MYLLDADEHWSWYVQLTALEVKEHTGTIKQKIFTGSSNSLCIDYLPQELWMSCAQACRQVKAAWYEIRQDIEVSNTERVDFSAWAAHAWQASAGDAVMRCQGAAAIDAVRKLSILLGLSNPNTPCTRRFGDSILRLQSQLAFANMRE